VVPFVDFRALRAVRAAKVASDYDSNGDADTEPGRNVAGGDAQRSANAGTQNDAQRDLHRWSLHFFPRVLFPRTPGMGGRA
jgi:hypothetical protein